MTNSFVKSSTYKPGKDIERALRGIDNDLSKIFSAIAPSSGSGGVTGAAGSNTDVQYNADGKFAGDSGFRYKTGKSVDINENMKFIMDGNNQRYNYMKYNHNAGYIEFYVDGEIRLQM